MNPNPRLVLRPGDRLEFDGATHTIVGLSGTSVRLRDEHGTTALLTIAYLQAAPGFHLSTSSTAPSPINGLEHLDLLDSLSPAMLAQARWWECHVLEVQTGLRPITTPKGTQASSADAGGRARYDPARNTLAQRDQAKAEELTALGTPVSAVTIRRRRHAYAKSGLWGLVDQRSTRPTNVGRVDERVITATRQAIAEQTQQSTGTRSRLRRRVEQLLAQQHPGNNTGHDNEAGPPPAAIPSPATFYRLLHRLDTGAHTFTAATTRRSLANRPATPFGSVPAIRPGQLVQIDTTTLDILVLLDSHNTNTETASGENTGGEVTGRVELTMLVDVASRTICTGVLRPVGTKAVDAALLLARSAVPEPMRPDWTDALRMRTSRLPHSDLAAIDARLTDAAAKPVIIPDTIVCDRGTIFLSETFLSACARLGISLQPAHPYTPTDKAIVERTFSSINTLFCQYVAGYTGRDVTRRGHDLDNQPLWTRDCP